MLGADHDDGLTELRHPDLGIRVIPRSFLPDGEVSFNRCRAAEPAGKVHLAPIAELLDPAAFVRRLAATVAVSSLPLPVSGFRLELVRHRRNERDPGVNFVAPKSGAHLRTDRDERLNDAEPALKRLASVSISSRQVSTALVRDRSAVSPSVRQNEPIVSRRTEDLAGRYN